MLHLRGLRFSDSSWRSHAHPYNLSAVQHVAKHGLAFTQPVSFFIGENGAGKTTLLEAIAARYPRLGSSTPHLNSLGTTLTLEDAPLAWNAELDLARNAAADGFFMRASTLGELTQALETELRPAARRGNSYVERSHGERLLEVLRRHVDSRGFYLLDEPETALSFTSTLAVVRLLHGLAGSGSQVICATHSPLLLSLPGAQILEFGAWGIRTVAASDLELLRDWRSFMASPETWLRQVLD